MSRRYDKYEHRAAIPSNEVPRPERLKELDGFARRNRNIAGRQWRGYKLPRR